MEALGGHSHHGGDAPAYHSTPLKPDEIAKLWTEKNDTWIQLNELLVRLISQAEGTENEEKLNALINQFNTIHAEILLLESSKFISGLDADSMLERVGDLKRLLEEIGSIELPHSQEVHFNAINELDAFINLAYQDIINQAIDRENAAVRRRQERRERELKILEEKMQEKLPITNELISKQIQQRVYYRTTRGGFLSKPKKRSGTLADALSDWYGSTLDRLRVADSKARMSKDRGTREEEMEELAEDWVDLSGLSHMAEGFRLITPEPALSEKEKIVKGWKPTLQEAMNAWGEAYADVNNGKAGTDKIMQAYQLALEIIKLNLLDHLGLHDAEWLQLLEKWKNRQ